MSSPLTQAIQIALDLSSDNDELRSELAHMTGERNAAQEQARLERALYDTACTDIIRLRQELEAAQAALDATRQAWKDDQAFRAANAPKNGAPPRAPSIPRQVIPPTEEMDT